MNEEEPIAVEGDLESKRRASEMSGNKEEDSRRKSWSS